MKPISLILSNAIALAYLINWASAYPSTFFFETRLDHGSPIEATGSKS